MNWIQGVGVAPLLLVDRWILGYLDVLSSIWVTVRSKWCWGTIYSARHLTSMTAQYGPHQMPYVYASTRSASFLHVPMPCCIFRHTHALVIAAPTHRRQLRNHNNIPCKVVRRPFQVSTKSLQVVDDTSMSLSSRWYGDRGSTVTTNPIVPWLYRSIKPNFY